MPPTTIDGMFELVPTADPLRGQWAAASASATDRMQLLLAAGCASDVLYEAMFGKELADVSLKDLLTCVIDASAQLRAPVLQAAFQAQLERQQEAK